MEIKVVSGDITSTKADVIIVNLFEGVKNPGSGTGAADKALGGLITTELANSDVFTGKLGQTLVLPTLGKLPARHIIVVGLGKQKDITAFTLRRASAAAVRAAKKLKASSATTLLNSAGVGGFDTHAAARVLAEGALLGNYEFALRKTDKKTGKPAQGSSLKKLTVVEFEKKKLSAIEKGLKLGSVIGKHTNLARDYVNDSANYVTPTFLKKEAEATKGLAVTTLGMSDIKKLKMGMFELVAKGSDEPPFLIHMVYKPKGKKAKRKIALVGKGLTFDSGGLSLKTSKGMETMKMDMGGAAAVIATMKAIAELGDLDVEVHGFVGTCENMPSGRSSKPGDIVTSMNGKTVEVNNTDAEGRLVLGDVVTYAQQKTDPDELIDLATLTGACVVALGHVAVGVMGNNQKLIDRLKESGERAGEKLWQLPLYDEYKKQLDSPVADLINANSQGEAGAQNGALFVGEFIDEKRPWAHLDIAGPAHIGKDYPEVPKGGTGVGVRTLLYDLYKLK